jgi:transcriptional regulator with XRE-family HTH domain
MTAITTYIVTREIAEMLRAARTKRKRSQSQVARALGVSQTTIQKVETGLAKRSSSLKDLWLYYALPANQFEELQRSEEHVSGEKVMTRQNGLQNLQDHRHRCAVAEELIDWFIAHKIGEADAVRIMTIVIAGLTRPDFLEDGGRP